VVKGTSNNSTEFRIRFDDKCRNKSPCVFDLFVRETIPGPVYLYIYFKNFYLNHRNVMRSFNKEQLKGEEVSMAKVESSCGEVTKNKHLGISKYFSNASPVDPESALNPCGILPSLYPSGSLRLSRPADSAGRGQGRPGDQGLPAGHLEHQLPEPQRQQVQVLCGDQRQAVARRRRPYARLTQRASSSG